MSASPNDTIIKAGGTADITDANGNVWSINNGQVALNGTIDPTTANVTEMAYENGTIWQENSSNLWWSKTSPSDTWGPAAGTSTSPIPSSGTHQPTTLTWVGSGNDDASNPANWAPNGVPQPGDTLIMKSGVINVGGGNLAGDTLEAAYSDSNPAHIIMSDGADIKVGQSGTLTGGSLIIQESGHASLHILQEPEYLTANIAMAADSDLTLDGNVSFAQLWVNTGTITNEGTIRPIMGGTIGANVDGTGEFIISRYADASNGITLGGTVGDGQTFVLSGDTEFSAGLIIANPGAFQGTIDVTTNPQARDVLTLPGSAGFTAYDLSNGVLNLYRGSTAVDSLHVQTNGEPVTVTQANSGVIVEFGAHSTSVVGTVLPVYSAQPTTLTWVGGGNNSASNPSDWSPNAAPKAGDTLSMTNGGTINIAGDDLAGNVLHINPTGTPPQSFSFGLADAAVAIDFGASHETFTYAAQGTASFGFSWDTTAGSAAIGDGSTLTFTGTMDYPYGFGTAGTTSATFVNNGTMTLTNGALGTSVSGNGTFDLGGYHDGPRPIYFEQAVQSVVTLNMESSQWGGWAVIDQPSQFHATVAAVQNANEALLLQGLSATDYTYQNGEMTLYNNAAIVEQLKMTSAPTAVSLTTGVGTQGIAGVNVSFDGTPTGQGWTILPMHASSGGGNPQDNYFRVADLTTGEVTDTPGSAYSGPVQGIERQFIDITSDKLDITALKPNVFIHSGSGGDALDVAAVGGTNVLDGSTGSNFLTGGSGNDTFYVDDRSPGGDIWTTIRNMHAGDNATVWGITPQDFQINTGDNVLPTSPGLNFGMKGGGNNVNLTLAGYSTSDLSSGKLTVNYGRTQDLPGLPGSNYMQIVAH